MRKCMATVILCAALLAATAFAYAEGSWGQINQDLGTPTDWQQLVPNSPFILGEPIERSPGLFEFPYGEYPSIDGSTVAVPMAMEFARQHLGLSDADLSGFVYFSTTHGAYEHLIGRRPNGSSIIASRNAYMDEAHPVDLIIATGPSEDERRLADESGVTLVQKPVCYDAFVFITHADNPVASLTVAQIQDIYSGQITNWRQVGGRDAEIIPYQREQNSGSQTAMEQLVMQGRPLDAARENYVTEGMGSLIDRVGNYENSIDSLGYTYQYYIDTLYRSDAIKVLAIDGIAPTPENLRSGAYPFTANYFGVIRGGEEQAVAGRFLDWMLTDEGQRCIAQAGYVPMLEVE